jgi:hypothetical protein
MRSRRFIPVVVLVLACAVSYAQVKPAAKAKAATTQTTRPAKPKDPLAGITDKQVAEITYDDLPPDQGFVTPVAENLDNLDDDSKKRLDEWIRKLDDWAGARDENIPQRVRNLLAVASLADLGRGEFEAETAHVIFEKLRSEIDKDVLIKSCAWIVLKPDDGTTPTKIPELGWEDDTEIELVKERVPLYAKKLLARLLDKLPKDR